MDKLSFNLLRSKFRKAERDYYRESVCVERATGCNSTDVFRSKLRELKAEFLREYGIDFSKFYKPTVRETVVSIKVVRKLDYPEWFWTNPTYN